MNPRRPLHPLRLPRSSRLLCRSPTPGRSRPRRRHPARSLRRQRRLRRPPQARLRLRLLPRRRRRRKPRRPTRWSPRIPPANGSTWPVRDGYGFRPTPRRRTWRVYRTRTSIRRRTAGPGTSRPGAGAHTTTASGRGTRGTRSVCTASGSPARVRSSVSVPGTSAAETRSYGTDTGRVPPLEPTSIHAVLPTVASIRVRVDATFPPSFISRVSARRGDARHAFRRSDDGGRRERAAARAYA
jgi:hypothetical protein